VKNDFAAKTVDEKFRITTFGGVQVQKRFLQKLNQEL
jgi:hypothetical protein